LIFAITPEFARELAQAEARRRGDKHLAATPASRGSAASMVDAAKIRAAREREFNELLAFVRGQRPAAIAPEAASASAQIIEAAETARRGGPELPAPTGMAAQIIAAGKKARGEV
jgi:hypothetical protein